jgi:vacuolar-type H+-ATPase subunit I/STV1
VSNYTLNADDKQEFEDWWDDTHCEGDTTRRDGEPEYQWAKEAFEYGVQYSLDNHPLNAKELESYEKTITELMARHKQKDQEVAGLTSQAVLLQEKIDALEADAVLADELLASNIPDNLMQQLSTADDEIDSLKDENEGLLLKVANYKDVIKLLVEMI